MKQQKPARPTADKAQRQRFIDAAREAGASEDEAVFDETLKRVARDKTGDPATPEEKRKNNEHK